MMSQQQLGCHSTLAMRSCHAQQLDVGHASTDRTFQYMRFNLDSFWRSCDDAGPPSTDTTTIRTNKRLRKADHMVRAGDIACFECPGGSATWV
jgi:hypothetical protein